MTRHYLLIDDNEAFAENLAEILRDTGADVDVAHEGQAAIILVEKNRFDAVVTDMRMPGMNGAQVLQQLRQRDHGLPAVLLSAYSHDDQLRTARRDGLLASLSKPQQIPRLLQVLTAARRDGAVLLVEDDVALADNLAEALADRGLTPVIVHDVAEVAQVSAQPFAALVDLRMPGAEFGEAMARVKERWPETPMVLMTAYGQEVHEQTGEAVFHKPFDTSAVMARLEALYVAAPKP